MDKGKRWGCPGPKRGCIVTVIDRVFLLSTINNHLIVRGPTSEHSLDSDRPVTKQRVLAAADAEAERQASLHNDYVQLICMSSAALRPHTMLHCVGFDIRCRRWPLTLFCVIVALDWDDDCRLVLRSCSAAARRWRRFVWYNCWSCAISPQGFPATLDTRARHRPTPTATTYLHWYRRNLWRRPRVAADGEWSRRTGTGSGVRWRHAVWRHCGESGSF